jgi:soluble lytic murein transglycosylase
MEADVWVENIPYNETRAYVQRVHWHSLVFDWLEDRKPRDVSPWLGTVRESANPGTARDADGTPSVTTR